MKKLLLLLFVSGWATGHELLPTYPKLEHSYVDGVYELKMEMFNRRDDISYYQIEVFDSEWNKLPFAAEDRIMKLYYLEKRKFSVYIKAEDKNKVTYICTRSKIQTEEETKTSVSSRVCSKIK